MKACGLARRLAISVCTQLKGIIFGCALFFVLLKGGCGSITPLNLIKYQGLEGGNSLYLKLWTHLDNREKRGLRLPNVVVTILLLFF